MSIRIVIADGQQVVRAGLKALLADTDIEIIGEAATSEEALQLVQKLKPDLLLSETRLPNGTEGLNVLGRLKLDKPETRVIMFSAYDNPRLIARAVALGAEGYLSKDVSRETLLTSIRSAASGENIWSRSELRRIGAAMATPVASDKIEVALTRREMEVLKEMVTGATNREIAQRLEISYETVKEHVQHVLQKVGVTDRTQAAVWAVRKGLA